MVGLKDHRVRIVVGILLLLLGLLATAASTHPAPVAPYYEENGSLSLGDGEVFQLPANITALYPYEYRREYSLRITLWGEGAVELTNTYTGERLNISLVREGVLVTIMPPAVVELSSRSAQVLRYSLAIYPSTSVYSELWLLILAVFLALIGAVIGVSGVMDFITKRLGDALARK